MTPETLVAPEMEEAIEECRDQEQLLPRNGNGSSQGKLPVSATAELEKLNEGELKSAIKSTWKKHERLARKEMGPLLYWLRVRLRAQGSRNDIIDAVRALGQERAERQTPVREMLDRHLVVVMGSDYAGPNPDTSTPNNPFVLLYYYVSRKTRDGRVLGPQEKISRQEALRIATNNNAFTTWEERVKGSIEPGKLADFVVLSGDFMTIPEDEILRLHPMATYVGGRKVYSAPDDKDAF